MRGCQLIFSLTGNKTLLLPYSYIPNYYYPMSLGLNTHLPVVTKLKTESNTNEHKYT